MSDRNLLITYDNPHYPTMLSALSRLGTVTELGTKTTVFIELHSTTSYKRVRRCITRNLKPNIGNAVYANLKTRRAFSYGKHTRFLWKRSG
jgi:hypothetical protein